MPSLTTYSPYETLVFFQNVAHYGFDGSSLQEISTTLNDNQFIRDSSDYDATKFSPEALQGLLDRTITSHRDRDHGQINGKSPSENVNPLKRKLSASPLSSRKDDPEQLVQHLVDELYARFKAETLRELRQQEKEYEELQRKITQLEDEVNRTLSIKDESNALEKNDLVTVRIDGTDPASAQLQSNVEAVNNAPKVAQHLDGRPRSVPPAHDRAQPSPLPVQALVSPSDSGSATPITSTQQPQGMSHTASQAVTGTFNRSIPQPSPQRNNYGSIPPPPYAYSTHPSQGQQQQLVLPSIHTLQRMPSHDGYLPQQRATSQGRGSPMPQHIPYSQQSYPGYPPYQTPPPHGWHSPSPQPYPQPYPPQQHFAPLSTARFPQAHTPNQPVYQQYPNTAPMPYSVLLHSHGPAMPPYAQYPSSVNTTPVPTRPQSRTTSVRSSSSTPWKRKSVPTSFRPRSPSRLDREISPLSDHELPVKKTFKQDPAEQSKLQEVGSTQYMPVDMRTMPAHRLSPSRSVASNTSENIEPPKRRPGRPPKIKPEQPSTPLPTTLEADSEQQQQQRSSGRRGRPRAGTTNVPPPELHRTTTATKRKRDAPSSSPASRARSSSNVQPIAANRGLLHYFDPKLVVVSKTFGKTSQLLLNEIMSHKLAGIFAKALTERDAPGYKDLVYRPQDLKGIRAAVSKGSRAAIAAIEALETKLEQTDTNHEMQADHSSVANADAGPIEGPIGNGFFLLENTEDLCPPKGIVNSSQLEMELVRMFANAIMFNPLPTSERGYGRSLRLRKRGGEVKLSGGSRGREDELDNEAQADENESANAALSSESESTTLSSSDERGIISDAREMFKDVEDIVAKWRELEGEHVPRHQSNSGSIGVERHSSVSASSIEEDESAPGMSTRKRRRIGD